MWLWGRVLRFLNHSRFYTFKEMLWVVIVHIYSNAGLERHRYVTVLWALIKGSIWLVARTSSLSGQKSCLSTPQPHSLVGQSWCVWYVCGEGRATQGYTRSCGSNFPSRTCGPQGVPRRFLTQHSEWDLWSSPEHLGGQPLLWVASSLCLFYCLWW